MTIEMNAEIRARWCMALRSGAYTQAKGILRNNFGFCCLAVLADIEGCEWRNSDWQNSDKSFYIPFKNITPIGRDAYFVPVGDTNYLTSYLLNSVGLSNEDQMLLSALNDDHFTFTAIANVIDGTDPIPKKYRR